MEHALKIPHRFIGFFTLHHLVASLYFKIMRDAGFHLSRGNNRSVKNLVCSIIPALLLICEVLSLNM